MLLWLWLRPAATAPIQVLAWEAPYAEGAAPNLKKDKKKKKKKIWGRRGKSARKIHQGTFWYYNNILHVD